VLVRRINDLSLALEHVLNHAPSGGFGAYPDG